MPNSTFATSCWLFELTKTFFKGAPISTPASVITTLISQVSMMLAFLMPLKVVMLLGSEEVPKFFPRAFVNFDRDTLIIFLVVLSITFYFVSLLFGQLGKQTTARGAKKLIANTQKIVIFENQDSLASNAYTKYTDALAGLIFALVTIGFFSIFYPDIAALTVILLLLAHLFTYALYSYNSKLETTIHNKPNAVTNTISNIVFLLIFLYIVVDFLYLRPPEFIIALATIIISRLMLSRLSITAAYLFSLKKDEGKINALFFHHHAFLPDTSKQNQSAWDLIDEKVLLNWLKPILDEASQRELGEISVQWKQTRLNNIVVLKAESSNEIFLIKIFEKQTSSQARHESTLLFGTGIIGFPSPPLILATLVENYHCHIFDIKGYELISIQEGIKINHRVNESLLLYPPPRELLERYKRSKAFLWERLETKMLDRLQLVASKQEKETIKKVRDLMIQIKSILQTLPLCFVNTKLNSSSLLKNSKNQIISFHWTSWEIEPAGAGINHTIKDLDKIISFASERRSELKQLPVENYMLASLLWDFERQYYQQQYKNAIRTLRHVNEIFDTR